MPIIAVTMVSGRTVAQKKELTATLAAECARICACPLEAVKVVLHEEPAENWNIGGVYGPDYLAARRKAAAAAAPAKQAAPAKKAAAKKTVAPKKPAPKKAAPKKATK